MIQRAFLFMPIIKTSTLFIYVFQIVIQEKADTRHLYFRYLPGTVRFITAFAKEIPLFKSLTERDQRLIIKSGILEISTINDSLYMVDDEDALRNNKLNVTIPKDKLSDIGLLGNLFTDLCNVMKKLRKLNFTDVELSLLSAVVLFCPGMYFEKGCHMSAVSIRISEYTIRILIQLEHSYRKVNHVLN